jgi:2-oxoisovalerate dehydrogenase E1 component
VGLGSGYALAGGKAVVEIMFGDFAALAADQIVNQAAKMHFMYGGKARVPTTIRLVSGGYRGYGPTHSQSLEAFFCGIPGLKVVALSRRHHPGVLFTAATLHDPNPVIFVENKLLYSLRPHGTPPAGFRFVAGPAPGLGVYPTLAYATRSDELAADITIVTYGGLTDIVEEAMEACILDEELEIDYFVLSQLSPLFVSDVVASVQRTGRLLVVEEGPRAYGVGAEVLSQVAGELNGRSFRAARVGAVDVPIPNSRVQEAQVLPSKESILKTLLTLF